MPTGERSEVIREKCPSTRARVVSRTANVQRRLKTYPFSVPTANASGTATAYGVPTASNSR